jgi:hypothetical protein
VIKLSQHLQLCEVETFPLGRLRIPHLYKRAREFRHIIFPQHPTRSPIRYAATQAIICTLAHAREGLAYGRCALILLVRLKCYSSTLYPRRLGA